MSQRVKARPYESRNRQEQAGRTRQRVIEAARRLFTQSGYTATTIQALADEAGVAVPTVYASFGSKREVLRQLFDTSVVGDDGQVALVDRPEWQAWEREADPVVQLDLFARTQRAISERAADVLHVLSAAAASDPEISRMYEDAENARYEDQRRLADLLSRRRALLGGLTRNRAADIIWTLAGPVTYTDLVQRRGWSAPEYEQWLSDQLRAALLAD